MSFYLLAAVIAVSCSVISLRTLISYTELSVSTKVLISLLVLGGWFAPVWISALKKIAVIGGGNYALIYSAGYALFGFVFILFSLLILRDVFWYLSFGLGKLFHFNMVNPKNISALYVANLVTMALAVLLAGYALYEGTKAPELKELTIKSPKIAQKTTLAVVTDMHITRITSVQKLKTEVEKINAANPDAILLVGDIIDDAEGVDAQLAVLKELKAKKGIFAVLGNHEIYRGYVLNINRFKDLGFKYLHNEGELIGNNIYIAGIPDYGTSTYAKVLNTDIEKALADSRPDNYKVLLSHSPSFIDTLKNNEIDLQVSGHTHGGQIFPFHFLVAEANKYLAGLYKTEEMEIYVSRGAGTWGPPMRLFAPSEVAVITFEPM